MIRQQYVALREQTRMETARMLSQKFGFDMPTMEEVNKWFASALADWFDSDYSKILLSRRSLVKAKKAKVVKEKKEKKERGGEGEEAEEGEVA